ncbi:DsrE family protein [Massilia sp. DJPM01]|nr:DsrE family protein [Massilia sp. DJPM01]MDM5181610.1 DsrE family protein [Massilia sp. DJPM01]
MQMLRTMAAVMMVAAVASTPASAFAREEKVVYHVTDSSNAMGVLGNVRNHLNASPKAKIVIVTHGPGIDFLLEDAKDKNGNPYDAVVQELSNRNVKFRVCNNTLEARKIDRKRVLPEATIVPSGVAEVARLQTQEEFAYIKP